MTSHRGLVSQDGSAGGSSGYGYPISREPEQGLDVGEFLRRVAQGWKVLLGAGLIAALLGAWVIYAFPRRYEAQVKLTVAPTEELSVLGASALGAKKPTEDILQEYAMVLGSPDVFSAAASQLRQQVPELDQLAEEDLQTIISIAPLKQEGRIAISAHIPNPHLARAVVAKMASCGVEELNRLRERQREAIYQTLHARMDSAQKAYRKAQEDLLNFQREQKYVEKNVQLRTLTRRVETLQTLLTTTEMELPKLQSKLERLQSLLPTLQPVTSQTFRWVGSHPLLELLAGALGSTSEKDSSGLSLIWESPSPLREEIQKQLLFQQGEWQALQTAYQKAQTDLQEALAQLERAQIEMDHLNATLSIAQWEVQAARSRYTAAQETLAKWEEDPLQKLPCIQLPPESCIQVEPKGLSGLQRWIGIEVLGLVLGVVVIFLKQELRRKAQTVPLSSSDQQAPSESEEPPMVIPTKLSA